MGVAGNIFLFITANALKDWILACSMLLLSLPQLYHALQHEITLHSNKLIITRIFGKPRYYSSQQFSGFVQTKRPYRPLLLLLQDGQQFPFYPKLKTEALSIRYVPVAGFIEYWTARLQNPTQAEGEVWPDDVME
jgi:hypothetical protein